MFRKFLCAATAAAVVTAPIQAACWKADEASAAGVRELQSMLMVAALRCQVAGHPMMDDYNQFVQANRTTIGAMNDRIKAHFIRTFGAVGGQRAYDSFTTSMANGYGAAASGADVCADADSLAREGAGMSGSLEGRNEKGSVECGPRRQAAGRSVRGCRAFGICLGRRCARDGKALTAPLI